MNKIKGFLEKEVKKMKTVIDTKKDNSVASVSRDEVFVKSAILSDIQKEVAEMRLCTCDDYEVCAYENS